MEVFACIDQTENIGALTHSVAKLIMFGGGDGFSPTFPTGLWKLRFSGFFAVKAESLQGAAIGILL
jgi:hypothetical protein